MTAPSKSVPSRHTESGKILATPLDAARGESDGLSAEDLERLACEPRAFLAELKSQNTQLRRSTTFLQTIIDAVPDIAVVIDRDYHIMFANQAAKQASQGKEPIAHGLKCFQVFHHRETPCEGENKSCPMRDVFKTKQPMTIERAHHDATGNETYQEINASPILDDKGEVIQVLEICRDITKRKQAEENLRKERGTSDAALNSLPGIFYTFNAQGHFMRWNRNFEIILGYSAEEILRMHPLDVVAERDRPLVATKIQKVFDDGQATVEASFRAKDGNEIPFLLTGVRHEINGKMCLLGMGVDITDRVAATQALERRVCQQDVVVELGRCALTGDNLSDLMHQVAGRLAETLQTEYCEVLELLPDSQALLLRAGVGWHEDLMGQATASASQDSQAGYTLRSGQPVIVEDMRCERRFSGLGMGTAELAHAHRVVSGMSVIIQGTTGPWGVLGVHATIRKGFSKDDVTFLQATANLLADAILRRHVEDELAASERDYHEIFNAVNDMIAIHDMTTGALLNVNTAWYQTFGYTQEESRQMDIGGFCLGEPPCSQEDSIRWIEQAAKEDTQLLEWACWKKSGKPFWIEASLKVAVIGGKKCLLVVARDISERKRTRESLKQSEERFRSLVESTSDWIWEIDQNSTYTYASPKIRDLLGYEPHEMLGKTPFDFMPQNEAERVTQILCNYQNACQPFTQVENMCQRKDGQLVMLETSGVPIIDQEGNLSGYRGIDRDITDRKQAREALRVSEQKYRVLFEQSADATLIIDGNEFVDCNEAAVKMLHYDNVEELLRTHPSELSPERQPDGRLSYEKANEIMALAFKKGSHRFEWEHLRADGEVFPVEVLLTAIPVGDKNILHVVWRDITERRQAQREREQLIVNLESQNAELERFTYTVSHDLKSPLITVMGHLGLLREDLAKGKPEAVASGLNRIENAADKMAQLLDDLLELSRVGRVVNEPQSVSLDTLVREAIELVGGQLAASGVHVKIEPNLPAIFGDHQRLLEVMQNLIDNAIKYRGDQTHPTIEIGSRNVDGLTVCYVKDNGLGIDFAYHKKVFELFDQLEPSSEGSGVGLALVKRIVEMHGGRIWVESEGVGHGTTFCFTIPPEK